MMVYAILGVSSVVNDFPSLCRWLIMADLFQDVDDCEYTQHLFKHTHTLTYLHQRS